MKRNVDLTENSLFWNRFFKNYTSHGLNYQQMFYFDECFPDIFTYEVQGITCKQVNNCKAVADEINNFARSDSLIATGNSLLREIKILVRKRYNSEVCEECDKPVRIPWNGSLCSSCMNIYKQYESERQAIPWSHYYSYPRGIRWRIPWFRW